MVFSLNCSLARFYRGIIQSSSDLLYPHVYCRPRSSRWLSCTSPRITGSSSISRWRVTRVPISSLVSPPLVSSLCPRCVLVVSSLCPRCVLTVSSGGLQGTITCYRNIAKLQSLSTLRQITSCTQFQYPHCILIVSSMYRVLVITVLPEYFRTSSLYGHRFITASSRPLNPLSDPCQSYLHAQLKRCQDITSQSLVYHGLLVS